jgi:hypothetical protein
LQFLTPVKVLLKREPLRTRELPVAFTIVSKVVPAKVRVEVPKQVTVPLLIVPPLKEAVAEIESVKPLQSSVPDEMVNFRIVVLAASTGRFV